MGRRIARLVQTVVLVVLLSSATDALAQSAESGASLYGQFCSSCHTIGGGDSVGPDLGGVTTRRDAEYLERIIVEPDQLIAEGDPIATELVEQFGGLVMPNLGLTPEQAGDLIAYIAAESGDPAPGDAPPVADPPAPAEEPPAAVEPPAEEPPAVDQQPATDGDAARGKDLFTGSERFDREGASCASCHTMARLGSLGGGTVGPDLTRSYERFGDNYIAFLATGTMAPIFDEQPLTAQEQADLGAFLALGAGESEPSSFGAAARFAAIGIGGALLLLAIGLVIWRDRLGSVRRRMIDHSTTQGK
ncbi:MAG: c-type cytochrome [Gaiellaceae bacterium]